MGFVPLKYDSGKITEVKMVASVTVAKGDALTEDTNGFYQRSTSSATEVRYVAMEGRTDNGTNQSLRVLSTDGVLFLGDTAGNTAQTDVGVYMDLTDHDTLNDDASTNDVFFVEELHGAAADRKVRGYFVHNIS